MRVISAIPHFFEQARTLSIKNKQQFVNRQMPGNSIQQNLLR